MCFLIPDLKTKNLDFEYSLQRELPQKGDIVFTPDIVYILCKDREIRCKDWQILWQRKVNVSDVPNLSLDFYADVIQFAEKNRLVFKIQVPISDEKIEEYIGEKPLASWEFVKIICKNCDIKVKISFAKSQPRWRYSRRFKKLNGRYVPQPGTLNFYQAFRLCLGQWKSLIAFCRWETSFVIAERKLAFARKFGKEFDLGTRKLTFDDYYHAYVWFYPTWYIIFLRDLAVKTGGQVTVADEFEENLCVMVNDNDSVATCSFYDYRMQRTRDKFYWDEVVNIFLGLESVQLPNYVLFEIISWIPYMQDISRNFAMKVVLKMFESVCKVRAQRDNNKRKK